MNIKSQIQKLDPGAIVELFELDTSDLGPDGSIYRFYAGTNELNSPVVWQGEIYDPFPIEAKGFDMTTKGRLPQPTVRVSNIAGAVSIEIKKFNDLIDAKVTRKRTFVKYLDAVNFPGSINPDEDLTGDEKLPDDIFVISRKLSENKQFITFQLSSPVEVGGVKLPRRQFIQNTCTWLYRSGECSYAGGPVADYNDNPTTEIEDDQCGKRLASCKLRFGDNAPLPFGGFPAVGLIK